MQTVRCLTSSGQPNKKKKRKSYCSTTAKTFNAENTGRSKVNAMEAKGISALRRGLNPRAVHPPERPRLSGNAPNPADAFLPLAQDTDRHGPKKGNFDPPPKSGLDLI